MKKIIKKIYSVAIAVLGLVCRILPIRKKRIYFVSNDGEKYSCNTRALFEYLYKYHKQEFDFVYIVNNEELKSLLPSGVKTAKIGTFKDFYYYYTSKVLINNFRFSRKYKKRKKQFYIQVWHGSTIAYKMLEKDAESTLSKNYIRKAKHDSKHINCLISGSDSCKKVLDNCFYCGNKTVVTGMPRIDRLINEDKDIKTKTYNNLGLSQDDYIVLYAPTFRDNQPIESSFLNNEEVIKAFSTVTNKNIKILYRYHPNIAKKVRKMIMPKNCINVTDYFDIQDLIMIADVMITDFSSCAFDMMLAKKPVLIYSANTEQYLNNERGLYFSPKELPFPISMNEEELWKSIGELNSYKERHEEKTNEFFNKMGIKEQGNACEQIYNIIKESIQ